MRIERSVISGNTADDQGGGIYAELGPLFLIDSTVSDNTSGNQGGGIYTDGPLSLSGTTVSGNTATTGNGGGIHVDDEGSVEIVNSTLSGNTAATANGGGIHFNEVFSNNIYGVLSNTITHTTITDNTAGGVGGGVALDNNYDSSHSPAAVLVATIVSGNTATGAGDEIDDAPGNVTADAFNVLGDSGKNNADAFNNFTPGASDISATSDGTTPTAIGGILNPTLADNGGPTLTHLLVDGSPALDTAPDGPATDQRGAARPRGAAWDSGAVEGTTPLVDAVFMSTTLPGTTGDGLPFGMEDIIMWDGSAWSMWFDGSAAGLTPTGKWKHNINAFWIP
ncbi:MAG TPA: choice-of-anchor Q domain-containing protein, partial [Promineifilum sp.]|nr:choice-of-anchor Q domain-containing protein [Promineifilum sp.]